MNKPFRNRYDAPRLSKDEAARQGRAASLAMEKMPSGAAVTFLNTHDETMGGRPIDLAVASPAGLLTVEQAIAARYP